MYKVRFGGFTKNAKRGRGQKAKETCLPVRIDREGNERSGQLLPAVGVK